MIDEGFDPLSAREDLREAPRIKDMIDRYVCEHLPKLAPANAGDQVSMLKKMVEPAWGNRLVTDITKSAVAKFLDVVAEGRPRPSKLKPNNRARKLQGHKPTPVRANRVGEILRKMFTLAMEWDWRADNPAQGFHRRLEQARERFLSPEELTRLAAVLDAADDQRAAAIIRMCMLTGGRVGEVRTARFEQFNLDYAIWSKTRRDHQAAQDPPRAGLARGGFHRPPAPVGGAPRHPVALSRRRGRQARPRDPPLLAEGPDGSRPAGCAHP
jgi:integrase